MKTHKSCHHRAPMPGAILLAAVLLAPPSSEAADSTWSGAGGADASWLEGSNWTLPPGAGSRVLIGAGSSAAAPVILHTAAPETNIVWGTAMVTNITWEAGSGGGEPVEITNIVETAVAETNIIPRTQAALSLHINGGGALRITSDDALHQTLALAGGAATSLQIEHGGTGGALFIGGGGWLHNARATQIAASAGTEGLMRVTDGGAFSTDHKIDIGVSGTGVVVVADGGRLWSNSNSGSFKFGAESGSAGFLFITNAMVSSSYAETFGGAGANGGGGFGYLEMAGGTNHMERQLHVGAASGSTGIVNYISGRARHNYGSFIGESGFGRMRMGDGFDLSTREFYIGQNASGRGIVESDVMTVKVDAGAIYSIGVNGHGEWWLRGTTASYDRTTFHVRQNAGAFGMVRGWGALRPGRDQSPLLSMNGLFIADGFGEERDLDAKLRAPWANHPAMISNAIENDGTNGWYAVNKGRLILNAVRMNDASGGAVSYGEAWDDEEIDLVNSARFTFGADSAWLNNTVTGAIYAADRPDIPAAEALRKRGGVACVWHIGASVPQPFTVDAQFRYDHAAIGRNPPLLLHYDEAGGRWEDTAAAVLPGLRLSAGGLDALGWFAAVAANHASLLMVR